MELSLKEKAGIMLLVLTLLFIAIFFFVETINQQAYTNRIITACNESRNQIALDYDFNLIEYDQNRKKLKQTDFNYLAGLN